MDPQLVDAVRLVAPFVAQDRKGPDALRRVFVDPTRVVATDRHRLVIVEGAFDVAGRTLVDPDTMTETTGVDDFPDFERFLAAREAAGSITVDATRLIDAIEAATGADDEPLAVQLDGDRVLLGDDAPTPAAHVNATYLRDAVATAGDGDIVLEITGETAPIAVRGATVLTLLMPVRVRAGR